MTENPIQLTEDEITGDRFLIYSDRSGLHMDIRFRDESLWMTQEQIARLFGRDVSVISRHIAAILEEGELDELSSLQKMQTTQGRPPVVYSLDMVISVGYRVSSAEATRFRRWATGILVQYARKGFVIDVRRLKSGREHDRIAELREIIRDLRADEANVYRELKRICSLCRDYEPGSQDAITFFQHTQAKLVYAVSGATPSEIVYARADASSENMGLQSWPREEIRKADVIVSKNYLAAGEIRELNRLTTILLDIFEDQMDLGRIVTMEDAASILDSQLASLNRVVLRDGGSGAADTAHRHAESAYRDFDAARKATRHAQADDAISELLRSAGELPKSRPKPKP